VTRTRPEPFTRTSTTHVQAADIILADDNFSTIVVAVEEGRKIFENITKFIVYLLSCNLSEVVLMLVAVAVGFPAPLNALQILYANIVSVV
jgi:Ca2+-transporting ATPase